ncbi:MAG: energy transducer TonB [Thermoanaerobaculia bacterium]
MLRRPIVCLLLLLCTSSLFAQLPANTILVKGAEPSASDTKTPLPEGGKVTNDVYENRYFGLSYRLPANWTEPFSGPPPSDNAGYVLGEFVPSSAFKGPIKGTVIITAQDLFFSLIPPRNARELIKYSSDHLQSYYTIEHPPSDITIAGRPFARFDYQSPVAGLHWYVLATEVRCHLIQFILNSRDPELLAGIVRDMNEMKLAAGDSPLCVAGYADRNVISKVDPVFPERKFNAIPVRVTIGKDGKVKHVHVISAFASQARVITDALLQWRFKPYLRNGEPEEVETGMQFGNAPIRMQTASTASAAQ